MRGEKKREACIFCKIVERRKPCTIVDEDEKILAFKDINPQAPFHVLLIPKEHFSSLNEVPEKKKAILGELLFKAREIARQNSLDKIGYRIVLNTEKDSGQQVFHLHLHLLGGRRMLWPPG